MKKMSAVIAILGILCLGWSSKCFALIYTQCYGQFAKCNLRCYPVNGSFATQAPVVVTGTCYTTQSGYCPPIFFTCTTVFFPSQEECDAAVNSSGSGNSMIAGC